MRKFLSCLLAVVLAMLGIAAAEEASAPRARYPYYFPLLSFFQLSPESEALYYTEPVYIYEAGTMTEYPCDMESVEGDVFARYAFAGAQGVDLGLVYRNGFTAYAYAEQLAREELYGFRFDFTGLTRDTVVSATTADGGLMWPQSVPLRSVTLAAGNELTLTLFSITETQELVPYAFVEMNATTLSTGDEIVLPMKFDPAFVLDPLVDNALTVTVTKLDRIRGAVDEDVRDDDFTPVLTGTVRISTKETVNIRAGDDASYDRLGVANPGDVFDTTGQTEAGWYEVILPDGRRGYIAPKMVKFTPLEE